MAITKEEKKAAEEKVAKKRAEKKAVEEKLTEMLKDNDTKFEITFTGSSVESITRMMTDRMMSSNTSAPMTSGFDFKI